MDGAGVLELRDRATDDTAPLLRGLTAHEVYQNERGIRVALDRSRDELLTKFGRETLEDRYLMPGESYQDLFARVAGHFADDSAHAQRLYDYISRLWFMPATPVLSNGGTKRGLPISCFLNEADDSLEGIVGSGRRMCGSRRAAAASAAIGAICAPSARRSARTGAPPASSPSCASWIR